jgi:hypothetical protein
MNSKQNAPIDTIPEQYRNNKAQSNKFSKFFTVPKASKEKVFTHLSNGVGPLVHFYL